MKLIQTKDWYDICKIHIKLFVRW